jgi:hypothetical protein
LQPCHCINVQFDTFLSGFIQEYISLYRLHRSKIFAQVMLHSIGSRLGSITHPQLG